MSDTRSRVYQGAVDFECMEDLECFLDWWEDRGEELFNGHVAKKVLENLLHELDEEEDA